MVLVLKYKNANCLKINKRFTETCMNFSIHLKLRMGKPKSTDPI